MCTNTWLAISAGATFLLAIGAFLAILQTHSIKRREQRHRILNEILDWALDIARCAFEQHRWNIPSLDGKSAMEHIWFNMLLRYHDINVRTEYIRSSAAKFSELASPLEAVSGKLKATVTLLDTYLIWIATERSLLEEEPLLKEHIQARIEEKEPKFINALSNCQSSMHKRVIELMKVVAKKKMD
jgi:hypothetical protein